MILPVLPSGRASRAGALGALWLLVVLLVAAEARAVKVLVKGAASLEGQVQADGAGQIVRGKLRDDLGGPVGGARMVVEMLQADGQAPPSAPAPRPCGGGAALPRAEGGYAVETDAQGAFCLRTQRLPRQGLLRVRFAGRPGLAGASVDLPFDVERPAAQLAWDPRPESLDLDVPQARVAAVFSGAPGSGASIPMELLDESGTVVARGETDERGRVLFEVATAELGGPGSGELKARARQGGAELSAKVVRTARVTLVGSGPAEAIVPHDGYRFEVAAGTQRGAAEGGVVEARLGGETLGAGAVRGGKAEVAVAFDVPGEGSVDLTFRYLPSSPGLRGGEPLVLRVPVKPPSPLRKAPLFLVGVLLVGWLARGWKRPPRAQRRAEEKAPEETAAVLPELRVQAEEGGTRWRGVVLDAHDRRALGGVEVKVVARDFYGEREVQGARTDERGQFEFQVEWAPTHVLQVVAPWHVTIERPLPRAGRMMLALVSRRRALLERLVAAGRRLAPGLEPGAEPTPEQIARHFEGAERWGGARWARSVEAAVFGRAPVGVKEETQLAEQEADLTRSGPIDGVRR